LRVVTLNVNGIRSAARKGLYAWLAAQKADVICLQEVKAAGGSRRRAVCDEGLRAAPALRREEGLRGVALYSRRKPQSVVWVSASGSSTPKGAFLEANYGKLSVISLYLPSGFGRPAPPGLQVPLSSTGSSIT
jgi:exodeoxyribonuclease-3